MSHRELDPKTASVEEVAAAYRRTRRDRWVALAVGIVCAALAYILVIPTQPPGRTLPILFIALAVGYIPTEAFLNRR